MSKAESEAEKPEKVKPKAPPPVWHSNRESLKDVKWCRHGINAKYCAHCKPKEPAVAVAAK